MEGVVRRRDGVAGNFSAERMRESCRLHPKFLDGSTCPLPCVRCEGSLLQEETLLFWRRARRYRNSGAARPHQARVPEPRGTYRSHVEASLPWLVLWPVLLFSADEPGLAAGAELAALASPTGQTVAGRCLPPASTTSHPFHPLARIRHPSSTHATRVVASRLVFLGPRTAKAARLARWRASSST